LEVFSTKGTRSHQKVLGGCILLLLALDLVGILGQLLMNEECLLQLIIISALLSLAAIVAFIRTLFNKDSQIRKNVDAQESSPWVMTVCAIIATPILIGLAVGKGLPVLAHAMLSQQASLEVTVKRTATTFRNKYCDGGVYIAEYRIFLNDQICGIANSDWQSLEPGTRLRLYGEESPFGFSIDQYQVLTNEGQL
jgi:hypothetical protein